MSEIKVTLIHGYKIGEDCLKNVVIRELTTGDIIEASESSEKLSFNNDNEPELVVSPSLMAANVLARQIISIGDMDGMSLHQLKSLHPDDYTLLQIEADKLDSIASKKIVAKGMDKRGRS